MPYPPRPLLSRACAHCGRPYPARHVRRTYGSRSCHVRACHARNGRPKARPAVGPPVETAPAGTAPVPVVPVAGRDSGPPVNTLDFFRQLHEQVLAATAAPERRAARRQRPPALEQATGVPAPG